MIFNYYSPTLTIKYKPLAHSTYGQNNGLVTWVQVAKLSVYQRQIWSTASSLSLRPNTQWCGHHWSERKMQLR